jgi:hypothetical protein
MTPREFKDQLFVSVARKDKKIDIRVGITLKAIVSIEDESRIEEAKEIAKNDIVNGVYGGRREELRVLINNLLQVSCTSEHEMDAYAKACDAIIKFQQNL